MTDVFDFTAGKSYWLASGRPSIREQPVDRVLDHVKTDGVVIPVEATIGEARRLLAGGSTDRAPVVNAHHIVLGTVSSAALDGEESAPISTAMAPGPSTIRPDEETEAVVARMQRSRVRSLLVTTPTGRLIGTFTATS